LNCLPLEKRLFQMHGFYIQHLIYNAKSANTTV
jgi:hypothetical protein